jgi:hypothetical protein
VGFVASPGRRYTIKPRVENSTHTTLFWENTHTHFCTYTSAIKPHTHTQQTHTPSLRSRAGGEVTLCASHSLLTGRTLEQQLRTNWVTTHKSPPHP